MFLYLITLEQYNPTLSADLFTLIESMSAANLIKYVVFVCLATVLQTVFAQSSKPSLWCGPANIYSCDEEKKIIEQRQQMQQRNSHPAERPQGQQQMARYWELLQRQREMMERQALRPN